MGCGTNQCRNVVFISFSYPDPEVSLGGSFSCQCNSTATTPELGLMSWHLTCCTTQNLDQVCFFFKWLELKDFRNVKGRVEKNKLTRTISVKHISRRRLFKAAWTSMPCERLAFPLHLRHIILSHLFPLTDTHAHTFTHTHILLCEFSPLATMHSLPPLLSEWMS